MGDKQTQLPKSSLRGGCLNVKVHKIQGVPAEMEFFVLAKVGNIEKWKSSTIADLTPTFNQTFALTVPDSKDFLKEELVFEVHFKKTGFLYKATNPQRYGTVIFKIADFDNDYTLQKDNEGFPIELTDSKHPKASLYLSISSNRIFNFPSQQPAITKNAVNIHDQRSHFKARYKHFDYPDRFRVTDDKVPWTESFPEYDPKAFTHPVVYEFDGTKRPGGWADSPDHKTVDFSQRFSYEKFTFNSDGCPLNPRGRTGMKERGLLGKWGPNHAADPIVTRFHNGKYQFVAIKRKDTGEWAIPGGMVVPPATVSLTLRTEFSEEALNITHEEMQRLKPMLDALFQDSTIIYKGYVDDPRNTDNAWMETVAVHFKCPPQLGEKLNLQGGDDAAEAKWLDLDENNPHFWNLYASHRYFLELTGLPIVRRVQNVAANNGLIPALPNGYISNLCGGALQIKIGLVANKEQASGFAIPTLSRIYKFRVTYGNPTADNKINPMNLLASSTERILPPAQANVLPVLNWDGEVLSIPIPDSNDFIEKEKLKISLYNIGNALLSDTLVGQEEIILPRFTKYGEFLPDESVHLLKINNDVVRMYTGGVRSLHKIVVTDAHVVLTKLQNEINVLSYTDLADILVTLSNYSTSAGHSDTAADDFKKGVSLVSNKVNNNARDFCRSNDLIEILTNMKENLEEAFRVLENQPSFQLRPSVIESIELLASAFADRLEPLVQKFKQELLNMNFDNAAVVMSNELKLGEIQKILAGLSSIRCKTSFDKQSESFIKVFNDQKTAAVTKISELLKGSPVKIDAVTSLYSCITKADGIASESGCDNVKFGKNKISFHDILEAVNNGIASLWDANVAEFKAKLTSQPPELQAAIALNDNLTALLGIACVSANVDSVQFQDLQRLFLNLTLEIKTENPTPIFDTLVAYSSKPDELNNYVKKILGAYTPMIDIILKTLDNTSAPVSSLTNISEPVTLLYRFLNNKEGINKLSATIQNALKVIFEARSTIGTKLVAYTEFRANEWRKALKANNFNFIAPDIESWQRIEKDESLKKIDTFENANTVVKKFIQEWHEAVPDINKLDINFITEDVDFNTVTEFLTKIKNDFAAFVMKTGNDKYFNATKMLVARAEECVSETRSLIKLKTDFDNCKKKLKTMLSNLSRKNLQCLRNFDKQLMDDLLTVRGDMHKRLKDEITNLENAGEKFPLTGPLDELEVIMRKLVVLDEFRDELDISASRDGINLRVVSEMNEKYNKFVSSFDGSSKVTVDEVSNFIVSIKLITSQLSSTKIQESGRKIINDTLQKCVSNKMNIMELHTTLTNKGDLGVQVTSDFKQFAEARNQVIKALEEKNLNIDTVLRKLRHPEETDKKFADGAISDAEVSMLRDTYTIYKKVFSELQQAYANSKLKLSDVMGLVEAYRVGNFNKKSEFATSLAVTGGSKKWRVFLPEFLALIAACWSIIDSAGVDDHSQAEQFLSKLRAPLITQIMAILLLLDIDSNPDTDSNFLLKINAGVFKKHLLQIGTGQGKSVILGMLSTLLGLLNFDVSCACYSSYLSARDFEEFKPLFQQCNVVDLVHYNTIGGLADRILTANGDVRNLTKKFIRHGKKGQSLKSKPEKRILLIDEVDVFFGQDFYGQTLNACVTAIDIYDILTYIWNSRESTSLNLDDVIKNVPSYATTFTGNLANFKDLVNRQITIAIACAKKFKSHLSRYRVGKYNGQPAIGYPQHGSVSYTTVYSYYTTFAYFFEKEKDSQFMTEDVVKEQSQMVINCGNFSYAEIPKGFDSILGLSGTLGTLPQFQRDIIENHYGIKRKTLGTPSLYGDSQLDFHPNGDAGDCLIFKESDNDYFYVRLKNEITAKIEAGRPVLVFFEDMEELNKFRNGVGRDLGDKVLELTEEKMTPETEKFYVDQVCRSGQITLSPRVYGRGVDFRCTDKRVDNKGGLHVIQTFLSIEESEEAQIKGRTARQGNKGSYQLMVLANKKFKEDFSVKEEEVEEGKKDKNAYDKFLRAKADKALAVVGEKRKKSVDDARIRHNKTIEFQRNLVNENGDDSVIIKFLQEENK